MKLSIVIPTKNSEASLRKCLESIKNQTYQGYELIVVDSSSRDKTIDIAREYTGKVYTNCPESLPEARNFGFSKANGDVFISIDSDMILEKELLEDVAKKMQEYELLLISEVGYGDNYFSRCKDLEKRCYIGDDAIECVRVFTKNAFNEVGGYDKNLHLGEDRDLHLRLKKKFKTGRAEYGIHHNTENLSIISNFKKAYKYGKSLPAYCNKKHNEEWDAKKMFYIKHNRKLRERPVDTAGLFIIRTGEYILRYAGFGVTKSRLVIDKGKFYMESLIGIQKTVKNWPVFFADYLRLIKKDRIDYQLRNDVRFRTRSKTYDGRIINEIWVHNDYTPDGFEINENDIVIDIGAHIGIFSVFASKFVKNGRIYAFEPVPENFEMLEYNISINNIKNITAINKAVTNKKEVTISTEPSLNTGGHSMYTDSQSNIKAEGISLEKFIRHNKISKINLLKIDCEGGEYEILLTMPDEILDRIDKISMEYHDYLVKEYNHEILQEFLEKKGYTVRIRPPMLYAKRENQ